MMLYLIKENIYKRKNNSICIFIKKEFCLYLQLCNNISTNIFPTDNSDF